MGVASDRLNEGTLEFQFFAGNKIQSITRPSWAEVEDVIQKANSREIAGLTARIFRGDGSSIGLEISNLQVDSNGEYHLVTYVGDEEPDDVKAPIHPGHDEIGEVEVGGNLWNKQALVKGKDFILRAFKYYIATGYADPELFS